MAFSAPGAGISHISAPTSLTTMTSISRSFLLAICSGVGLAAVVGVVACNNGQSPTEQLSTATTGTVAIGVDETFSPIIQAQVDTFSKLYPDTKILTRFQPEEKVMLDFLNDEVKIAVVS